MDQCWVLWNTQWSSGNFLTADIAHKKDFAPRGWCRHSATSDISWYITGTDVVMDCNITCFMEVILHSTLCHSNKYQRFVAEEVSATQSRANSIRFPPSQHIFLNDLSTLYAYVLQLRSGRFQDEFPWKFGVSDLLNWPQQSILRSYSPLPRWY